MTQRPEYSLLICPVCRVQVDDDPEYGAYCHHEEYGEVEAVRVPVLLVPLPTSEAIRAVEDDLKVQRRKHETRMAMFDWVRSLPQEEQDRMEAERRSKLSPLALATEVALRAQVEDAARRLRGESFLDQIGGYTTVEVKPGTSLPARKEQ